MNRKELAAVLGVSPTAIGHWEKEGMPVVIKAGQGSPNDYNLEACLVWLKKNGKGQSVRSDRPGAAGRIDALMQTTGSNNLLPENSYLTVTEKQIDDAIVLGNLHGRQNAIHWVAENFLIAAASLIRFSGLDPESAVNQAFHIAFAFESVYCMAHNLEQNDHAPNGHMARWLSMDKDELTKLAGMAVEMQSIWDAKQDGL